MGGYIVSIYGSIVVYSKAGQIKTIFLWWEDETYIMYLCKRFIYYEVTTRNSNDREPRQPNFVTPASNILCHSWDTFRMVEGFV